MLDLLDTSDTPPSRKIEGETLPMKRFKWLQYLLHAAVLGGLIYAGTKYVRGDQFLKALHQFNWLYAPLILLLAVGYVLVKGWRFVGMMRQLTDTSRWVILRAYVAGQACSLLPGGAMARAGILQQAGVPAGETAAPVTLSSLSDCFLFLLVSLVAALWFESVRKPVLLILTGLAALSLVLGMEASRTWLLRLVEKLMGRIKMEEHWRKFVEAFKEVATWSGLLSATWNAGLAFLLMLAALYLSVRGMGASVSPATLLLAYTLPALLGRLSAMPGGVGVTEAGMVGILSHAPGVGVGTAAAAVAVFRVGTTLWSAVFGGIVYLLGWRGRKEAEVPAEPQTPEELGETDDNKGRESEKPLEAAA